MSKTIRSINAHAYSTWQVGPANATWSGRINRAQVLRTIRDRKTTSRPELSRLTGLTPATISNVVRDLVRLRLVSVTGETAPRRQFEAGAPAALLGIDRTWHRILAVHQGVSRLRIAAADIAGDLLVKEDLPVVPSETWGATADRIAAALRKLVATSRWRYAQVRGVGVGAVGLVDPTSGVVRAAPNLGWRDAALRQRLEAHLPWPVIVRNNVHAMALGEQRLGGLDSDLGIYVYVGTGIGSAILVTGELLSGAHGAAGEFGHIAVPGGGACSCGKTGCLETVAAEPAIAVRAAAALPALTRGVRGSHSNLASGHHKAVVQRLVARALEGDATAAQIITDTGTSIGLALAQVTELLDPGAVVVNGIVAEAGDLFFAPLSEALHATAFTIRGRRVGVRAARYGRDAGLVGAAALAMDESVYSAAAELLGERVARAAGE